MENTRGRIESFAPALQRQILGLCLALCKSAHWAGLLSNTQYMPAYDVQKNSDHVNARYATRSDLVLEPLQRPEQQSYSKGLSVTKLV